MKHPTPARFGAAALAGALAACLLAAALTAALLGLWHSRRQMALLDGFCTALVDRAPAIAEDRNTKILSYGGRLCPLYIL